MSIPLIFSLILSFPATSVQRLVSGHILIKKKYKWFGLGLYSTTYTQGDNLTKNLEITRIVSKVWNLRSISDPRQQCHKVYYCSLFSYPFDGSQHYFDFAIMYLNPEIGGWSCSECVSICSIVSHSVNWFLLQMILYHLKHDSSLSWPTRFFFVFRFITTFLSSSTDIYLYK